MSSSRHWRDPRIVTSTPSNKPIRHDLSRFHEAQEGRGEGSSFATALEEIRSGRKCSHWIWYVFPQLPLGSSSMSRKYAIADADEARAYLRDDVLRERLLLIADEVRVQLESGVTPTRLMASEVDTEKLSSSMTLFTSISTAIDDVEVRAICEAILQNLKGGGIGPCNKTTDFLHQGRV